MRFLARLDTHEAYLHCRNLSPSAAKDMLIATLRWRDEFNVEAACREEFPKEVFGQIGHVFGKDKEGRPVVCVDRRVHPPLYADEGLILDTTYMEVIRTSRRFSEMSIGS